MTAEGWAIALMVAVLVIVVAFVAGVAGGLAVIRLVGKQETPPPPPLPRQRAPRERIVPAHPEQVAPTRLDLMSRNWPPGGPKL
jgi:hypothetical protein